MAMTKHARTNELKNATVTVWTPWGMQSVPKADSHLASVRRIIRKAKDGAATRKQTMSRQ
jgi:hypothetical protein